MNKQFFAGLMSFIFLSSSLSLTAQYTDTSKLAHNLTDSVSASSVNWKAVHNKNAFPYKSLVLPSSMIVYGILALNTDAFKDINETVKEEVYTERQPGKTHIDNYLQYSPAVAVYALNAAGIHGKNNFRDRTIIYGMSSLIMSTTVFSIKKISGELRPDGSDKLSFPSGHTANAFAAAEFLRQEYKDVSPWYGIAGYAAAAATGYLRVSNNRHWAGDVIAGAGVGIMSTKLAYWIYPAIKRKLFKDKDVHTVVMPTYQNGSIGLGLVHNF
jgi:PAP2 superfamily